MNQRSSGRTMRTVLITGATGFIGSNLVSALCSTGTIVRAFVRDRNAAQWLQKAGAELVVGDLTESRSIGPAIAGVDTVFHCAALARGGGFPSSAFESVNVLGTRHLFDACRGRDSIERVVHVSTVAVLGDIPRGTMASEEHQPHPTGIYGVTKLAAERLAREADVPTVIARPMWVYGWRSHSFIRLVQLIAHGRMVVIGGGRNAIQPIAIDDLVNGLILCATRAERGEVYHLAGPEPLTTARMCREIAEAIGVPAPRFNVPLTAARMAAHLCERLYPSWLGRPPIDLQKLSFFTTEHAYSIDKAREHLGWQPQITFNMGVAQVAAILRREGLLP